MNDQDSLHIKVEADTRLFKEQLRMVADKVATEGNKLSIEINKVQRSKRILRWIILANILSVVANLVVTFSHLLAR